MRLAWLTLLLALPALQAQRATPLDLAAATAAAPCVGLGALATLSRSARIVGLGEATHGSAEFGRAKRQVIRCWLATAGITTVAVEAPSASWEPINRWVRSGEGNVDSLLAAQGFWMWNVLEMRELLGDLRDWNAAHPDRPVRVVGVDPKYPERSLRAVLDWSASAAPAIAERFRPAVAGFPHDRASFMAWRALSREAQEGLVRPLLALPGAVEAASRTPGSPDTAWRRARWDARVVAHAVAMQLEDPTNFATDDVGAEITLYLRLARSARDVVAALSTRLEASTATRIAARLSPLLGSYLPLTRDYARRWTDGERTALRDAVATTASVLRDTAVADAVVRRGARAVGDLVRALGYLESYVGRSTPPRAARDTAMADLATLALDEDGPDGRVVIWAHDYHVSRQPISFFEGTTMGGALAGRHGAAYVAIGFAFGQGGFLAEYYPVPDDAQPRVDRPGTVVAFSIPAPPVHSAEHRLLAMASQPTIYWLTGQAPDWARTPLRFQRYGSGYADPWYEQSRLTSVAADSFDALVWFPMVSPSTRR
ncbi:MAG: erythromycin esterase family protein [Gemmatimonadaceae bacterium]|nr:erythromycin esterase family protein [Gemmatimonadaceae bacterium]